MASIIESIEILSKEKGINPQIVISAVTDAMLVAARKKFGPTEELVAELNPKTDQIDIFVVKRVVEEVVDPVNEWTLLQAQAVDPEAHVGGEVRLARGTESLGRISAQTAKQVILQKVREAERETIYSEYYERVGELVNCAVKRVEGQDLICDLGKTEARLPKKEQSRLDSFSVGERVRCVIKSVEKTGKNAGVVVSRAAPELVVRLFEQEVPEIYDSTVVVKGCAREAGERTKIAVLSRDRDVDCVGACVGMKGMRVQSIIRELRGEKIDIIEYSEDPVVFATHALSPAKISRVAITSMGEKHMEVIVDDSQLSLAIGKKGQNVRLGAKLLGWKIDIKSEEEKRQEVESQMAALVIPGAPVSSLMDFGLAEEIVGRLVDGDVGTVEKLGSMTPEELENLPGIDADQVEQLRDAVIAWYGQFDQSSSETSDTMEEEPAEELPVAEPASVEESGAPAGDLQVAEETAETQEITSDTATDDAREFAEALSSAEGEPAESAKLRDADQA